MRWSIAAVCLAASPPGLWGAATSGIPADRLIRWRAGVEGGIPNVPTIRTLTDLPGDGKTDAVPALQKAIDAAKGPGAIVVPAGTYVLKSPIRLNSGIVLRGAGLDKTHLLLDVPTFTRADYAKDPDRYNAAKRRFGINRPNLGAIRIAGKLLSDRVVAVTGGHAAGSRRVTVASGKGLAAGQTLWIFQDNDHRRMGGGTGGSASHAPYARHAMGQLVRVTRVRGRTVDLDVPLRLTHQTKLTPRLIVLDPITRAGLEDLHVRRLDRSFECILDVTYAVNCWVRRCRTEYAVRSHVAVNRSRFVTVEGNYLHHAWSYGGGGSAYGINLREGASDNLVTDNVLHTLRHALMTKQGANGNVLSYNYSFGAQSQFNKPLADLSAHGHYPHANLYEGNVVQRVGADAYWGWSGPGETYFRNRTRLQPVLAFPYPGVFVANTCPGGAVRAGKAVLNEGNLVKGKPVWHTMPASTTFPASLYLPRPPAFWPKDKPWPCVGADVDARHPASPIAIPAQDRYAADLMPRVVGAATRFRCDRFAMLPHPDRDHAMGVYRDGSVGVRPGAHKRFAFGTDIRIPRAGAYRVTVRARAVPPAGPCVLTLNLPPENRWRNHRRIHAIRSGRWMAYSWPVKLTAGVRRFELVALGNRDPAVKDKIPESQELRVLDLTLARQAD